ncbi:MAG TPA: AIR synthase-related protein [Thermomicrobiales bacterium]|nr:AIR synthase-related protein [Thermomicrobiales bacterium]
MTSHERSASAPLAPGKLPPALLGHLLASYRAIDPSVIVGPGVGRDAAVVEVDGRLLVVATDPITFATRHAADHLVDVNANDLACLGATPRWLLVTALFHEGIAAAEVEAEFAALARASARRGVSLVGGHSEIVAGLDRTILVGLMIGETTAAKLVKPGGARPGDRLILTKGLAIEGTALLARELADRLAPLIGAEVVQNSASLLADPGISIVADALTMCEVGGVTALHDPTEGGLAMAAREVGAAAGCGVRLDRAALPILPETHAIAAALGLDPIGMLASGSLLVAARPEAAPRLLAASRAAGVPATEIGEVVPADIGFILVEPDGVRPLPQFETDEVNRALIEAARAGAVQALGRTG